MEKYVKNLIDQFATSKGINFAKATSKEYRVLLKEYLRSQERMILEYIEFLKSHNIEFDKSNCVEIGKSGLDSMAKNTNAKILTNYLNSFEQVDKNRIIEGNFDSYYGRPAIITKYGDDFKCESPKALGIDTFMTQNPYSNNILTSLKDIEENVVVGIFGSNYDFDFDKKIEMLNNFKQRLCVPANIEYDTKDNNYYCVVTNSYTRKK